MGSRGRASRAASPSSRARRAPSTRTASRHPYVVHDAADSSAPYRMWYARAGSRVRLDRLCDLDRRHDLDEARRRGDGCVHGPGAEPRRRRLGRQLRRRRSVGAARRRHMEALVHGRRLQQEADRLRDLTGRRPLDQGRQGDRARGSGRQRQLQLRRFRPVGVQDRPELLPDAADRPQARQRLDLPDEGHGCLLLADGISWSAPSPAVNPAGNSSKFDYSNLDAPYVLPDPGSGSASYKLYYAGNTLDANGNFHTRIGYATSSDGNSFGKVAGSQTGGSLLDVGTAATAFDARSASGLSVVAGDRLDAGDGRLLRRRPGQRLQAPARARDLEPTARAGARSPERRRGGSLLALVGAASSRTGSATLSALYDENSGAGTNDWFLFYTAEGASTTSIGRSSGPQDGTSKLPDTSALFGRRIQVLAPARRASTRRRRAPVGHQGRTRRVRPLLWRDRRLGQPHHRTRQRRAAGRPVHRTQADPQRRIGRIVRRRRRQGSGRPEGRGGGLPDALHRGSSSSPAAGRRARSATRRRRMALSGPSAAWFFHRAGCRSRPTRRASTPRVALIDGSTLRVWAKGVDRSGRGRAVALTTPYPTPGSATAAVPSGDATYQLGDATTSVRDFRRIGRSSTGSGVSLWVSFLQPYSSSGSEFWSDWFPVAETASSAGAELLADGAGVRWQARLSGAAGVPHVDRVEMGHAPVRFAQSGEATTTPIAPPEGQQTTAWGTLTATSTTLGGGSVSGTLSVLDAATSATARQRNSQHRAARRSRPLGDPRPRSIPLCAPASSSAAAARDAGRAVTQGPVQRRGKPPSPPPPPPVLHPGGEPAAHRLRPAGDAQRHRHAVRPAARRRPGALLGQPAGAAVASALATVTSDAAGTYRAVVSPDRRTVYSIAGATGTAPAAVEVAPEDHAHRAPQSHARHLQRQGRAGVAEAAGHDPAAARSRWVTYKKLTTTASSTFALTKRGLKPQGQVPLPRRHRGDAGAPRRHERRGARRRDEGCAQGLREGTLVTFTGSVRPRHSRVAVTIEELVGTRWVKVADDPADASLDLPCQQALSSRACMSCGPAAPPDRDHFGGISAHKKLTLR